MFAARRSTRAASSSVFAIAGDDNRSCIQSASGWIHFGNVLDLPETQGRGNAMTAVRARSALLILVIGALALVAVSAATSASPPPALKNGGTLTIGLAEDPDALDPTIARTFVGRMVFMHM